MNVSYRGCEGASTIREVKLKRSMSSKKADQLMVTFSKLSGIDAIEMMRVSTHINSDECVSSECVVIIMDDDDRWSFVLAFGCHWLLS